MKRCIPLFLLVTLLLSACVETEQSVEPIQPVSFYYRTIETDFTAQDGVIRAETRDLGQKRYSDRELFELYCQGPQSDGLTLPFSQDTELTSIVRRGGTLELKLTRSAYSPSEFDHSLAYACLAKTAFGLDGVYKVLIEVRTRGGALEDSVLLSENDILLYDSGEEQQKNQDVTLYYADEAGMLLLTEKRTVPSMNRQDLAQSAQLLLELLLSSPRSGGMQMALPPGTAILDDLSVENGICTVDFNDDFYANRPEAEQAEQLTLLSVVNTLCELDGIKQVQFYVQGKKLPVYVWLNLSEPWTMDSAPVGPIREELGEFAGTLCLPDSSGELLHRLTVRARARGITSREEALLSVLFSRAPQNGMAAPFSGATAPLSVTTSNHVCTVRLSEQTLPADRISREIAIRSIVATLCSLPEVDTVLLHDGTVFVSDAPLAPSDDWFYAPAGQDEPEA